MWKLAFAIWEKRNSVLHGKKVAQNREIAQEVIHNKLRELYATYAEYPAFIHQSAGYLFEKPLTKMLGKGSTILAVLDQVGGDCLCILGTGNKQPHP